jgi:hypothetical protein
VLGQSCIVGTATGRDMAENHKLFEVIDYKKLNGKQKELFNFQKLAATLADYGFNCIKLADDWQGADFLAYPMNGKTTLKIQLKSRLTIHKKYCGKEIWIAFPFDDHWYLIDHDRLVDKVGIKTKWLTTDSWLKKGSYHSANINSDLLKALAENKLGRVYGPLTTTDE